MASKSFPIHLPPFECWPHLYYRAQSVFCGWTFVIKSLIKYIVSRNIYILLKFSQNRNDALLKWPRQLIENDHNGFTFTLIKFHSIRISILCLFLFEVEESVWIYQKGKHLFIEIASEIQWNCIHWAPFKLFTHIRKKYLIIT